MKISFMQMCPTVPTAEKKKKSQVLTSLVPQEMFPQIVHLDLAQIIWSLVHYYSLIVFYFTYLVCIINEKCGTKNKSDIFYPNFTTCLVLATKFLFTKGRADCFPILNYMICLYIQLSSISFHRCKSTDKALADRQKIDKIE